MAGRLARGPACRSLGEERVTTRGQDPLSQDHLWHLLTGAFPPPLGLGICMFETSPLGVLTHSSLKALGHHKALLWPGDPGKTRDWPFISGILLAKGKGKIPPEARRVEEMDARRVLKEEEQRQVFWEVEREAVWASVGRSPPGEPG